MNNTDFSFIREGWYYQLGEVNKNFFSFNDLLQELAKDYSCLTRDFVFRPFKTEVTLDSTMVIMASFKINLDDGKFYKVCDVHHYVGDGSTLNRLYGI